MRRWRPTTARWIEWYVYMYITVNLSFVLCCFDAYLLNFYICGLGFRAMIWIHQEESCLEPWISLKRYVDYVAYLYKMKTGLCYTLLSSYPIT